MNAVTYERQNFFSRLIWLFPAVYLFHIAEEVAGFSRWVTEVLHGVQDIRVFLFNNTVWMLMSLGFCWMVNSKKKTWATFILFLWVSGQEFWNFVFHLYCQYRFKEYSPGLFTAVFLYFPVYGYLSYLCVREGYLSQILWLCSFGLGSLGMVAVIWGNLYHFGEFPWAKWFG